MRIVWMTLLVLATAAAFACRDETIEGGHSSGDGDADGDGDGDADGDADADVALGSLCHSLVVGDADIDFTIVLGAGADQVSLTASTGECSTRLGGTCRAIPGGPAVPIDVYDYNDERVLSGAFEINNGAAYLFRVVLDENEELALQVDELSAGNSCSDGECIYALYNEVTCDEADVCYWESDGYCDDYCYEQTITPLDDSTDCGTADLDCSNIVDSATCIQCECAAETAACLGDADCLAIIACINDCDSSDTECATGCLDSTAAGLDLFMSVLDCTVAECSDFE